MDCHGTSAYVLHITHTIGVRARVRDTVWNAPIPLGLGLGLGFGLIALCIIPQNLQG